MPALRDIDEIVEGIRVENPERSYLRYTAKSGTIYRIQYWPSYKQWRVLCKDLKEPNFFASRSEALQFVMKLESKDKLSLQRITPFGKSVPNVPFRLHGRSGQWEIFAPAPRIDAECIAAKFRGQKFKTRKEAIEAAFEFSISRYNPEKPHLYKWIFA